MFNLKLTHNIKHNIDGNERALLWTELIFAVIIAVLSSLAAFSTLLFCPNNVYPLTADSMGHLTKVRYLAECFSRFEFPSWFPQWYNGSTVMQYYPPLSYIIMAVIEMFCKNVTLTYKVFCFLMLFIGGMGIWVFCRKYIGKWCGLFGIATYCMQTFLTRSLFGAGVLAQGPVFALSPWFIIIVLSYADTPRKRNFALSAIFTFLLILSHAMHAFIVCLCIAVVLFYFVLIKRIKFFNYFTLGVSMAIGAMLAGYWWMVGATGLENPGIPYLLEEAGLLYTATLEWYLPGEGNKAGLVFAISITLACIAGFLVYLYSSYKHKNNKNDKYYSLYNILLTFFTFIFSFGQYNPLFKIVPLYRSLVPGRILSLSAVSGAIVCSYLLYSIIRFTKGKNVLLRSVSALVCVGIISAVFIQMNPYKDKHEIIDVNELYDKVMSMNSGTGGLFDKGRYEWIAPVHSGETYFPVIHGFNTADGWNIEGTPHNRSIWSYNVALVSECEEYVIKDMLFWNVRSIFTLKNRTRLRESIDNSIYDLKYEKGVNDWNSGVLYTSDLPSSYFLVDKRDFLISGKGSTPLTLEFPFMAKNTSNYLSDYPIDKLKKFKLIYIAEPPVETEEESRKLESIIRELIENGTEVIIEPSNDQTIPLFGVSAFDINFENDPVLKKVDPSFKSSVNEINFNETGVSRAINGLDEVYYKLFSNNGRLQNDIIGSKNIGSGNVYFIGMHLSQYLISSQIYIYGYNKENTYPYAKPVKTLLEDLFSRFEHNKSFMPDAFPVKSSDWNYKGCKFEYESNSPQQVTVSVSYTPRWNITVDGEKIPVTQRENLILLDLPEGRHKVEMHYGITVYGFIGYVFSFFGLLTLIIHVLFYKNILDLYLSIGNRLAIYFEMITNKRLPQK